MNSSARESGWPVVVLLGALVALPGPSVAQPMFKCLQGDAVTYSNTACEQLGLKSAGVVQNRITTMPLGAPIQVKDSSPGKPQSIGKENEISVSKASSIKPVNPVSEKVAR